jgi:hypothetical protein
VQHHSRRFFELLPIYAQLADEIGLLEHFCDQAVQPLLDFFYEQIDAQQYRYNVDHPLSFGHLDWLGQFVGLGEISGHHLGIGINPDWTTESKRRLIKKAWKYWQYKGTEQGVRDAIAFWLLWEESQSKDRLEIILPLGKSIQEFPPGWIVYGNQRNLWRVQTTSQTQRMGWCDRPSGYYIPRQFKLTPYEGWGKNYGSIYSRRILKYNTPPHIYGDLSRMGSHRPWLHFNDLSEEEWRLLFPGIFELNGEMFSVHDIPTVVGWLKGGTSSDWLIEQVKPNDFIDKPIFDSPHMRFGDIRRPRIDAFDCSTSTTKVRRWLKEPFCRYGHEWGRVKILNLENSKFKAPVLALAVRGQPYVRNPSTNPRLETISYSPAYRYYSKIEITEETRSAKTCYKCLPGAKWNLPDSTRIREEYVPNQIVETRTETKVKFLNIQKLSSKYPTFGQSYSRSTDVTRQAVEYTEFKGIFAEPRFGLLGYPWGMGNRYYILKGKYQNRRSTDEGSTINLCNLERRYGGMDLFVKRWEKVKPDPIVGLRQLFPGVENFTETQNWEFTFVTDKGWFVVPPHRLIALNSPDWRSAKKSTLLSKSFPYLLLEVFSRITIDCQLLQVKLELRNSQIKYLTFDPGLFVSHKAGVGFRQVLKVI